MKLRYLPYVLAIAGALTLSTFHVLAGDDDDHAGHDHGEGDGHEHGQAGEPDEMTAEMAAWIKLGVPGEHHEHLKPMAGKWNVALKMWMDPAAPPQESAATVEYRWILDGRFLQEEVKGHFMGEPFEGLGFIGYDNLQKKYTTAWMESMGTMIITSMGTCDSSGKVFNFTGEHPDPMTGGTKKSRYVMRLVNDNKMTGENHETGPDGQERKTMELVYTRM
ncbi:MAG: DUF1579 domain-containing protein [bacterium]|nr:DUF1579 domain-containing protein [bacterium]